MCGAWNHYEEIRVPEWRLAIDVAERFRGMLPGLEAGGTLIFKWCEVAIPLREILELTDQKPLYGHKSGRKAETHWMAFVKA